MGNGRWLAGRLGRDAERQSVKRRSAEKSLEGSGSSGARMRALGAMLVLLLFQHFGVASELAYRGRETDFPPGNASVGPIERLRALQAIYYGAELVKLIAGGILASYLFVFHTSRRGSRKEVNAVDHADHRHVNR